MSANSGAAIGQRGKQRFVVVAVGPNPALAVAPDISIDLEPLNDNAPMKEKVNPRKPAKAYALDADTGEQIWSARPSMQYGVHAWAAQVLTFQTGLAQQLVMWTVIFACLTPSPTLPSEVGDLRAARDSYFIILGVLSSTSSTYSRPSNDFNIL